MNNIERDLRRRLKKSIRKRTELNDKILKFQKEKQELIEYLKSENVDFKEIVKNYEERLRNTPKDSYYYNSYLKTLHRYRAKRELIKEILSKIEGVNNE